MHLYVKAGSLNELDHQQGVAHFLEHMLFNGSTHYPPGELVKYFQKNGVAFGHDLNAYTDFDRTVYNIILPKTFYYSDLSDALDVFKDYIEGALLLESEIEKEKGIILSEKITPDSTLYRTGISFLKFSLPDTLLPNRLPIGKEEIIKKADKKLLRDFYDVWYRPENIIIILVGDFNPAFFQEEIKKKFSDIAPRAQAAKPYDIGTIDHKRTDAFYYFEKEESSTTVTIETVRKIIKQKDSINTRKEELINSIGDRIVWIRLNKLLNDGKAAFNSFSVDSTRLVNEIYLDHISADTSSKGWEKTLFTLEQTLRTATKFGFYRTEIKRVKEHILTSLDNNSIQNQTRSNQHIANRIIEGIATNRIVLSPEHKQQMTKSLLSMITKKQVDRAFKNKWKGARLLFVSGNANLSEKKVSIIKAYNKSKKTKVEKFIWDKRAVFPYLKKPDQSGKIIKQKELESSGIIQIDFENGLRLNLKKTSFEKNSIRFSLNFGSGKLSEPPNLPGLSMLATNTINKSGTKTLTTYELNRTALVKKNTRIAFNVGPRSFSFSGTTEPNELELAFQLLYTHFMDIGFRKTFYNMAMDEFTQKYISMKGSVDGIVSIYGDRFLAGDNNKFGYPEYDTFKRYSLEDVKNWIDPLVANSSIEISVVGDFDIESVIEYVSAYFGGLPERPKRKPFKFLDPPSFPKSKTKIYNVNTKISKSIVIVAYLTNDLFDIKQTRRLKILNRIFSDRMREIIREKQSLAYSVYSIYSQDMLHKDYGMLKAVATVESGMEDKIVVEIKNIAKDIILNKISSEELKRAQKPFLEKLKLRLTDNTYWLNNVLVDSVKINQKLDWCRDVYDDYASININEINELANRYLKNDESAVIISKRKE